MIAILKASVAARRAIFEVFLIVERKRRAQGPNIDKRGSPECRSVDWAAIICNSLAWSRVGYSRTRGVDVQGIDPFVPILA